MARKSTRSRNGFVGFLTKAGAKTGGLIKDYDGYGESVSLTLNGQGTHQTVPGGLISMIILVVLWAYALLQLKIMINKEDWSLI
jgi:hypothetical protein